MKKNARKQEFVALVAGVVFGAGLLIGGMTRPEKIVGFLDVLGNWDPSLALVMLGAVSVHFVAYRAIRARERPFLSVQWSIPRRRDIDVSLLAGAALFGVGWGLSGYCPGPAITSLPSGSGMTLVFVAAMVIGMIVMTQLQRTLSRSSRVAHPDESAKLTTR